MGAAGATGERLVKPVVYRMPDAAQATRLEVCQFLLGPDDPNGKILVRIVVGLIYPEGSADFSGS